MQDDISTELLSELSVIGSVMIDPATLYDALQFVHEDDFSDTSCKTIFKTVCEMATAGREIDPAIVAQQIKDNSCSDMAEFIAEAMRITPTASNAPIYAEQVRKNSKARQIHTVTLNAADVATAMQELIEKQQAEDNARKQKSSGRVQTAADVKPESPEFLWRPYIPLNEYTVVFGSSGTGKTLFLCGIAAALSSGRPLLGQDERPPTDVLFVSSEDSAGILTMRLKSCGADLTRVHIVDRDRSSGMDLTSLTGAVEFRNIIKNCHARLVIVDPWQAFIDERIDLNRMNMVRPALTRITNLIRSCDCSMILVSHVNKRAQSENANNAASGSSELINASRSAIRLMYDDTKENVTNRRIAVHTKSNLSAPGKTVAYEITDNSGVSWIGYSEIDRTAIEEAARKNKPLSEVTRNASTDKMKPLINAIDDLHNPFEQVCVSYDELKDKYGAGIFAGSQPAAALSSIRDDLRGINICLSDIGTVVKNRGYYGRGFKIIPMYSAEDDEA